MDDLISNLARGLVTILENNIPLQIGLLFSILLVYIFFITKMMIRNPYFKKIIMRLMGNFFYTSQDSYDSKEIYFKMEQLEQKFNNEYFKNNEKAINEFIEVYVKNNFSDFLNKNLNDTDIVKNTILSNLKNDVKNETINYLNTLPEKELENILTNYHDNNLKENILHSLNTNLISEEKSVSTLKRIMTNLFVLITFSFMIYNIYAQPTYSISTSITISIVYFSLCAFLFYVIRTSHFRSSVILAIREDQRKINQLEEFLRIYKKDKELTEHDVDVIRMIMTNHSEREQKAKHPYEVIMKGISGTNIQFQGGKIGIGGSNNATEKP